MTATFALDLAVNLLTYILYDCG